MKTQTNEVQGEAGGIREALKALNDKNPNGGEITLNDFCKMVPSANRRDAVRLLKKAKEGVFITGRRGRVSRFVYGNAALPFLTKGQRHYTPRSVVEKEAASIGAPSAAFELRIKVDDQITTIPVELGIGVAAAA